MLILPSRVRFLLFQQFKVFSRLRIFSSKFSLLACSVFYEKCTPRAQIGFLGHLKLNGVSILSLQLPSHIASVLLVLISSPETDLKSSRSFNSMFTEFWSLMKTVVSSAYCVHFISFEPTLIPLIV